MHDVRANVVVDLVEKNRSHDRRWTVLPANSSTPYLGTRESFYRTHGGEGMSRHPTTSH